MEKNQRERKKRPGLSQQMQQQQRLKGSVKVILAEGVSLLSGYRKSFCIYNLLQVQGI